MQTNRNSTRRSLLVSATALILSIAMLVGTTFAWFTDTASTGVNKIQAGNLDVGLEMYDGSTWVNAEGKTLQFKKAAGVQTGEQVLWEPGCTYELPQLRVVNKGNLALKYKIQITGIQGDAKLNKVINWTINDAAINLTEGYLSAGQEGDAFTIKGHMKEEAGNEYKNLTIDGIAVTVYATQKEAEYDSFGNSYDANATYPVEIIPAVNATMSQAETNAEGKVTKYSYSNSDNTLTATYVPTVAAATTDPAPKVVIEPTSKDAGNVSIDAASQDAIAYDISLRNANDQVLQNTGKTTFTLKVGKGLSGLIVYHNANAFTIVNSENQLDVGKYYYDTTNGIVKFVAYSYSPFTIVFDSPVALVNGVSYYSLQDALNVGGNVVVLKDVQLSSQVKVNKTVALDLNGKTISYSGSTLLPSGLINVGNGGNLTVYGNGSIVSGNNAYAAITVIGNNDVNSNAVKLTIENGTFQGRYYPISGNGTYHNTEITINGGTFSSTEGLCIYHPQEGTLTINGGSFEGQESAIEIRSGTLTIHGGTFKATDTPASSTPNGNGTTSNGVAIAVAQHTTKKPINVTINGGTFEGYSAFYESNPQNNSADDIAKVNLAITGGTFNAINGGTCAVYSEDKVGFITGGMFSSDPSAYVATGYEAKEDGGKYVVRFSGGAKPEQNTVVPDGAEVITDQDTLDERLSSAKENVIIYIGEGEFNIDNVKFQGKTIEFVGSGYDQTTLLYGTQPFSGETEQGSCYSFKGANVTFKDVTLQDENGNDVNYEGFVGSNGLTFENCLLKSRMTYLGVNGVSFKNCTFNTPNYAAWIYSSQTYNFKNCLFESSTGRFLNIYSENHITPVINATECMFIDTSNGTDSKAVFNIKTQAKTNLTIQDCVVKGASPLYKVESDNGTTVKEDGRTVYGNAN